MPRPNNGPRLVLKQPRGYRQSVYFIRWFERGNKRERSTGHSDLRRAEEALSTFIAGSRPVATGGPCGPDQMRVSTALGIYGQEHAPNAADPERIAHCIVALLGWWGDKPVSYVKGETCRAYDRSRFRTRIDKNGKEVRTKSAKGTTRRELQTLSAALSYCVKEGHLTHAPIVTLPEKALPKERWLTRDEASALIRAARRAKKASRHLPLFILIGLYTGARHESILALQWQPNTRGGHVDLEAGRIDFNAIGRRQTKKRRPNIPIPPRLLTMLRYARRRTRQFVLEYRRGRMLKIRKAFSSAATRAKLRDVTPHTLRHTAATWLMQSGAEKYDACGFLGMDMETLERVYAKHHPDHLRSVAALAGRRKIIPASRP